MRKGGQAEVEAKPERGARPKGKNVVGLFWHAMRQGRRGAVRQAPEALQTLRPRTLHLPPLLRLEERLRRTPQPPPAHLPPQPHRLLQAEPPHTQRDPPPHRPLPPLLPKGPLTHAHPTSLPPRPTQIY